MFDSVSPAESGPIGVVSPGWLRAARFCALICTIDLCVGFALAAPAHGSGAALIMFGLWGSFGLALLYLLFRGGKNSLAFALGLGTAPYFIVLLGLACFVLSRISKMLQHLVFVLLMCLGGLPPFFGTMRGARNDILGALLLCLFGISLAILALSSRVAFRKMAHEAKGMGKLRLAFGAGIGCAIVVWLIFTLLGMSLTGPPFGM